MDLFRIRTFADFFKIKKISLSTASVLTLLVVTLEPYTLGLAADRCSSIFRQNPTDEINIESVALDVLKHQEEAFDQLFKTVGYGSYDSFVAFLKTSRDPVIQKAIKIVEANQFEVLMARTEDSRIGVAQGGFKNIFETNGSGGIKDQELRTDLESTMMAITTDEFKALDHRLKAKYLSFILKAETGIHSPVMVSPRYGTDIYTFKMDLIKDQLTFFPGDSLDHVRKMITTDFYGIAHKSFSPTRVEMMFIPWSRRLLMVPFMIIELGLGRFGTPFLSPKDYRIPLNWTPYSHFYWEAQKFGNLDLSHVSTFEFRKNPPEGEFLQELKRQNILILDGRTQPPRPYTTD